MGKLRHEKDKIQFLGLTGLPYRSLLRIQYGASIICKRAEKACSLLLQMKHGGKHCCVNPKSRVSSSVLTGREGCLRAPHSKSEMIFPHRSGFRSSTVKWQHHRHTGFGREKVDRFKNGVFLNFWSVKRALVC